DGIRDGHVTGVQTCALPISQLVRHAILRELNRDGQVYFVHNRVYNIKDIASKVQSIVPEARIVIGHGQMPEHELEHAMVKFVRRSEERRVGKGGVGAADGM